MFALYSKTTGVIQGVYYQQPTSQTQIDAIAAAGMAFVDVPDGISPHNSFIHLDTGKAAMTGPKMTHYHRYQYDPATGMIMSTVAGNVEDGHPMLSAPNQLVSESPIQELRAGLILVLDKSGLPTKDATGKYLVKAD